MPLTDENKQFNNVVKPPANNSVVSWRMHRAANFFSPALYDQMPRSECYIYGTFRQFSLAYDFILIISRNCLVDTAITKTKLDVCDRGKSVCELFCLVLFTSPMSHTLFFYLAGGSMEIFSLNFLDEQKGTAISRY